jgi:uncharacterized protein (DUF1800 family)
MRRLAVHAPIEPASREMTSRTRLSFSSKRATFVELHGLIVMLPQADDSWTPIEAAHLLNRAGFGGDPEQIHNLHALGRKSAVESLLAAKEDPDKFSAPEWAHEEKALADFRESRDRLRQTRMETRELPPEKAAEAERTLIHKNQKLKRSQGLEAQGWWFKRMLGTKAPLREKMTLFWHDHFACSLRKVREPVLIVWQNELFLSHALGNFKELTHAILVDPAMMRYLDTQNSKKGQPNENFAREVMELFTLGEGNYSEQDIRQAARAFTGYEFSPLTGKARHNKRQWDGSPKTVFGKTGNFDGADVINLVFEQSHPAKFITAKIWEFFVHDAPSPESLDALADTLRNANYEIIPLLREIFLSKEFYGEAAMRTQIKCPVQFIVQLCKQLDIEMPPVGFAANAQQQLGQSLFLPPNVAGWDWGKAWINTSTLLTRYNLAGFLIKGSADAEMTENLQGMKIPRMGKGRQTGREWMGPDFERIAPRPLREKPEELVDSLIFRFFQGPVAEKARHSFVEYAISKKGVILTNNEVAELCHLMLSTPYYQLC